MNDMEIILKEAEKRNVNVYTHGEMLPAHGYPKLREYKVCNIIDDIRADRVKEKV